MMAGVHIQIPFNYLWVVELVFQDNLWPPLNPKSLFDNLFNTTIRSCLIWITMCFVVEVCRCFSGVWSGPKSRFLIPNHIHQCSNVPTGLAGGEILTWEFCYKSWHLVAWCLVGIVKILKLMVHPCIKATTQTVFDWVWVQYQGKGPAGLHW